MTTNDDESVDSESTLAGHKTKDADESLGQDEASEVIVAIHRLSESNDESFDSESTLVGSPLPTRLTFPDESTAEETYQTMNETGTVQETVDVQKVTEDTESVVESISLATEENKESKQVIKTAVATGRVFAPRGPGELLISVNLSTLNTVDENSVDSGLAALIDESSEQEEVSQETETNRRNASYQFGGESNSFELGRKVQLRCQWSSSRNVLTDNESMIVMEIVQEEVACTIAD